MERRPDGSLFDSARDHSNVLLALQWSSYLVSSSKESSSLSSSPSLGKSSCDFLEAKKIVISKKKGGGAVEHHSRIIFLAIELNICLSSSSSLF